MDNSNVKFEFTEKGDWVLDPFMGRGTTGIDLYPENVERSRQNIADARAGKCDEKLVEVVAREADLVKPSPLPTNGVTLESYLLNKPQFPSTGV